MGDAAKRIADIANQGEVTLADAKEIASHISTMSKKVCGRTKLDVKSVDGVVVSKRAPWRRADPPAQFVPESGSAPIYVAVHNDRRIWLHLEKIRQMTPRFEFNDAIAGAQIEATIEFGAVTDADIKSVVCREKKKKDEEWIFWDVLWDKDAADTLEEELAASVTALRFTHDELARLQPDVMTVAETLPSSPLPHVVLVVVEAANAASPPHLSTSLTKDHLVPFSAERNLPNTVAMSWDAFYALGKPVEKKSDALSKKRSFGNAEREEAKTVKK